MITTITSAPGFHRGLVAFGLGVLLTLAAAGCGKQSVTGLEDSATDPLVDSTSNSLVSQDPGIFSRIVSNFNGTDIAAGNSIWFSSVCKYKGPTDVPVTIAARNVQIRFVTGETEHVIHVPNSEITFDWSTGVGNSDYDYFTDTWQTQLRPKLSGNQFLGGAVFPVLEDLPGGIKDVSYSAEFYASSPMVEVEWKWAAAVYTRFSSDYNALGVKASDDNKGDIYQNSHHAGTPENFTEFVIGGARGGGGSNFTGSYSGTAKLKNLPPLPADDGLPSDWAVR